jgi:hypothetical protein
MRIQFTQGKLKGEERKAVIEEIQQQLQEAALAVISSLLRLFLEEELTAKLGREKGEPRRMSVQAREMTGSVGIVAVEMPTTLPVMGIIGVP